MSEKLTEQLPVRLTPAQREHLRQRTKQLQLDGIPGRITEADIIRALITKDIIRAREEAA
jgi:hypothetical protein